MPRIRSLEVNYTVRVSLSFGLDLLGINEVHVDLPVRIFNPISFDPPPDTFMAPKVSDAQNVETPLVKHPDDSKSKLTTQPNNVAHSVQPFSSLDNLMQSLTCESFYGDQSRSSLNIAAEIPNAYESETEARTNLGLLMCKSRFTESNFTERSANYNDAYEPDGYASMVEAEQIGTLVPRNQASFDPALIEADLRIPFECTASNLDGGRGDEDIDILLPPIPLPQSPSDAPSWSRHHQGSVCALRPLPKPPGESKQGLSQQLPHQPRPRRASSVDSCDVVRRLERDIEVSP